MFIRKKEWEKLNDKVDKLCSNMEVVNEQIQCVNRIHLYNDCHFVDTNTGKLRWCDSACGHKNDTVNTSKIQKVTLDELANFVLDGTPIKRREFVDVEYKNDKK